MSDSRFYAGGLASFGGPALFPSAAGEESIEKFNDGPSAESATKGGPGTPHGSKDEGDFLDASTYKAASDMRDSGMKVIDLNDVSHDAGNISSVTDI